MPKQIKTHLRPALGASSAAPGVVYTQIPVMDTQNHGKKDALNGSADNGGTRREYSVNRARPGKGGSAPLPH